MRRTLRSLAAMLLLLGGTLGPPRRAVAIEALLPNLRATLVGPDRVAPGVPFDVELDIRNDGTAAAAVSVACLRGEQDGVAFTLAAIETPALFPAAAHRLTMAVTWPLVRVGRASLTLTVDCADVAPEANEGDNVAVLGFEVAAPLAVATRLPDGNVNLPYATSARARGGALPYTFVIDGLPGGLIGDASGAVRGTTSAAGTFDVTITVVDGAGARAQAIVPLTIRADRAPDPRIEISPRVLDAGTTGHAYCATLQARGGDAPFSWSWPTEVPPGLEPRADGTLCGVPEAAGAYTFEVVAVAADGAVSPRTTIAMDVVNEVFAAPPAPAPELALAEGCGCAATRDARGGALVAAAGVVSWAWARRRRARSGLSRVSHATPRDRAPEVERRSWHAP